VGLLLGRKMRWISWLFLKKNEYVGVCVCGIGKIRLLTVGEDL
jgi:hypothetical protein